MSAAAGEVAQMFGTDAAAGNNLSTEIFPGYPGLVFDGSGLRTMTWGFPLVRKGKSGQLLKPKPVNNTRADKLDSPFWRASFRERRCLIPLTTFTEAEGPKNAKTRTWFNMRDQPIFTCAGIWRDSAEWGPVYSMIMTDASPQVAPIHDRMPVVIAADKRANWLESAPDQNDIFGLSNQSFLIERTEQRWV
ncbi:SOS response-associated peptidase [Croceicoccus sp. YJ47]|uniref:SOS response-associated peptidase n=1 Tax=Croceicoccus sp. YJ47 TaxID=2798724 RepID=UPI001F22ADDD|nr:SOS response-associated peptidase family protein [Croceicoccus sp. YJ47]